MDTAHEHVVQGQKKISRFKSWAERIINKKIACLVIIGTHVPISKDQHTSYSSISHVLCTVKLIQPRHITHNCNTMTAADKMSTLDDGLTYNSFLVSQECTHTR